MVIYEVRYYIICDFEFSVIVYGGLHQRPNSTLQLLYISKWVWKLSTMDFVIGLPRTLVDGNVSL